MDIRIDVSKNGPYLVSGEASIEIVTIETDDKGVSREWRTVRRLDAKKNTALCRCGQSANKPYCDGTHAKVGFDGTETAHKDIAPEDVKIYKGPALQLEDAEPLCAFARFCDADGTIWRLMRTSGDEAVREVVTREAAHCPSGRLVLRDEATGEAIEPKFEQSIALIEDPAQNCSGPIWVRGGIPIASADGPQYEVRNRVTLCRCGASANKPFCDGQHADEGFQDGLI